MLETRYGWSDNRGLISNFGWALPVNGQQFVFEQFQLFIDHVDVVGDIFDGFVTCFKGSLLHLVSRIIEMYS